MKLKEFTVREFRSIWHSGTVKVDKDVTCLVGKNEAGKTALLTALYRTNPIISNDAEFDAIYDYPKREIEDYRFAVENGDRGEAIVVECTYELEDEDIAEISSAFEPNVLEGTTFTRFTYYGKKVNKFSISVNDDAARAHLASDAGLSDEQKTTLKAAGNWPSFLSALESLEMTESTKAMKLRVAKIHQHDLAHYIFNSLIWPRASKYLYFDEYYQMLGQANLNALIGREDAGQLEESDYPLLGLINLARLDHRQLVQTKNTAELKNKLEGAGNYLTRRIIKYWSQNKHIKMEFDVRDGKPEDPEGMRDGVNVWGEVHDTVHWAHTPLGSRSRGFVWFFSFLAWYEDIKRQKENVILLLDEPGLSLHGRAQGDLLKYFQAELADRQLIYTTHSPFMINPHRFDQVRIVQDLSIDASEELPRERDGTKVLDDVFDATEDSLFPLQGALGYEIQQTLFIGPNSLVVEGPGDMLFLRAVSAELQRERRTGLSEKWVITPVGGSGKVPTFVALLAPQKGLNVATLLDIQASDRPSIENIYKKKLLKKKQVLTYADFLDQEEADVEDLFERGFYVDLVNKEFGKDLSKPIDVAELDVRIIRTVRAIESWLKQHPLKSGSFGHYRPARYFVEHINPMWELVSEQTKDRFEGMFRRLNDLLK